VSALEDQLAGAIAGKLVITQAPRSA